MPEEVSMGAESKGPGESGGSVSEQLSEEAKQRFAAAAAGMQQIRREEKRSRKRDDQVARTIIQFLGQDDYAHLFVLISRLVARDCPSIFILAVLSLIHEGCREAVREYLKETTVTTMESTVDETMALMKGGNFDETSNRMLVEWITRMQLVLSLTPQQILLALMVDEQNIDGTVLQLATFVLQEFFSERKRAITFEKLQPLTVSILQAVFQPFMGPVRTLLRERAEGKEEK
ncbi:MAG: hypothetical protein V1926_05015 [Candidatus Peregrinibacteria bacterium]